MSERKKPKRVKPKRAPKKAKGRGRPRKGTADWAPKFLAAVLEGMHVRDASHEAGVDVSQPYRRRLSDQEFALAWKEARTIGLEAFEEEAGRRAYHGTLKPVFYRGRRCGSLREYSDTLLMFLLRAQKPATYRETQKHEHSGTDGGPLSITLVEFGRAAISGATAPDQGTSIQAPLEPARGAGIGDGVEEAVYPGPGGLAEREE